MPGEVRRKTAFLLTCLLLVGWSTFGEVGAVLGQTAGPDAASAMGRWSAAELEQVLWEQPQRIPEFYLAWADDLEDAGLDSSESERLLHYAVHVASLRAQRVFERDRAEDADVDLLLAMLQLDPQRFFTDGAFRRRVASAWAPLKDHVPPDVRLRLVERLATRGLDDFDVLESVAVSWELVARSSLRRRLDDARLAPVAMPAGELAPIEASIVSLPPFLGVEASAQLLSSVHRASPERQILVLADAATSRRLLVALLHTETSRSLARQLTFLPTLGVDYSPWPRDPLTLARRADGGLHVVLRGNVQRGREADRFLGRALVQGLPADLDERWGRPTWHRAELPFHNGQILDAAGASWVSVHSLEPRVLELLGTDRLPVERFAGDAGRRFVEAARRAAAELAELRGRPVRFVHALPAGDGEGAGGVGAERAAQLGQLAGGAGIDLDSVLTLLPRRDGLAALVADVGLGSELVAGRSDGAPEGASDGQLAGLSIHGLAGDIRAKLHEGQTSPGALALDRFLEHVVEHLRSEGLEVHRLPLLWIDPAATNRADRGELTPFLVNWNNVVLEERPLPAGPHAGSGTGTMRRAEGFASGLPAGDEMARGVYSDAGFELRLHPPLVESVVRNGGFRCSSQHVRRADPGFLDTPGGAF